LIALAVDTATEILALSLSVNGDAITMTAHMGLRHAETLIPWIKRLFEEAKIKTKDLDLVVCGTGPGSFTGVRIGLATAKGLALGTSSGLVGVSTLDALAWRFRFFDAVTVPVIDAKKNRIYAAFFSRGDRESDYLDVSRERLSLLLDEHHRKGRQIILTGPYAQQLASSLEGKTPFTLDADYCMISPSSLLEIGMRVYSETGDQGGNVIPLYLRKSEAELQKEKNAE
jgi:tRNA threonylcarbamoyladenosine biosynthesis protein TsaB